MIVPDLRGICSEVATAFKVTDVGDTRDDLTTLAGGSTCLQTLTSSASHERFE